MPMTCKDSCGYGPALLECTLFMSNLVSPVLFFVLGKKNLNNRCPRDIWGTGGLRLRFCLSLVGNVRKVSLVQIMRKAPRAGDERGSLTGSLPTPKDVIPTQTKDETQHWRALSLPGSLCRVTNVTQQLGG